MSATHLDSFLLKITNRCNFNCDHCYFRHQADRSYMSRPKDMKLDRIALFAECLGDYTRTKQLDSVNILFHGGEPLLLGPQYLEEAVRLILRQLPASCQPIFSLQSNGSLLNQEFVDSLRQLNVSISISLDGEKTAQDRHRVFAGGLSSFETVVRNIRSFLHDPDVNRIFGGILAVVDLRNDPIRVFDFLSSMTASGLDFLLPDGTHVTPPPGITEQNFRSNSDYANWLIPVFDKWFNCGKRKPSIRLFENILAMLLGGKSDVEGLGGQYLSLLTIETDGEIRDSDVLSVSYEHAARFGAGVYLERSCFEHLIESEAFQKQEMLYSPEALNEECQVCYWRTICGGGLLPHRYSMKRGFDNPSIYCGNLKFLFSHIRKKLIDHLQCENVERREPSPSTVVDSVNHLDWAVDFMRSWDFPLEPVAQDVQMVEGSEGNISETGDVDEPTAISLTPAHPRFFYYIEAGVRELVKILVEDINCITYSSCQGHRLLGHGVIRPRNVGILCRDETEQLFLNDLLQRAAGMSKHNQPKIFKDCLESGKDSFRTVEIVFEANALDSDKYWSTVEEDYHEFVRNLKCVCGLLDTKLEVNCDGIGMSEEQLPLELEKIFGDYQYDNMSYEPGKVVIYGCSPFYNNEALSVICQARRGKIAIVNNHAWSLMFWLLSAGPLLRVNSNIGVHLIHIDYHSDLAVPRLYYCDLNRTIVDYFSREPLDLWNIESIAKATRSTAIGPGSFILPFLYLNRRRRCKVDLIVPERLSYEGDSFNGKEWSIETDGRPMPGSTGKTLRLTPCASGGSGGLWISCTPIYDADPQVDFDQYVVIIDIDFDFFSNRLKGSTDWAANPGWHPDLETRAILFRQMEDLLTRLLAKGFPNAITVATSPDFCPQEVRREAFNRIKDLLTNSGLEV